MKIGSILFYYPNWFIHSLENYLMYYDLNLFLLVSWDNSHIAPLNRGYFLLNTLWLVGEYPRIALNKAQNRDLKNITI